jgi:hypothetical protein
MSDIKGFEIREEAGILAEGKLTDEQRQAGTQVFELIKAMVASPEKPDQPTQSYLPRIDKARHNRVILIDGGRGSGKTALLLTLLECWRRQFNEPEAGKPSDIPERWIDRSQRIVPVGLLDLHPLPRSTNLLLHVVGRFERVVAWIEGDGKAENEPAAWHFTASGELESRKKWKKLLRAVAAGWDGSVEERSGRLDLEAYAVDLEEAEHQRLDVVSTFAAFIDALAVDFRKRQTLSQKTELPLFVLAVDDADMNPRRSVELLDVLRMLWHPRLAFVLTGDTVLFRHTLAEHFLGELRHPLRGHMLLDREIAAIADQRPAMSLANEVYDKIIPTGHRCVLVPIPAKNRFSYPQTKLQEVFAKITTEPGNSTGLTTLASHFENEPQLREALPDRLRGLIDLADQASVDFKTGERVPYAPASRIVEAIWHQAVRGLSEAIGGYNEDMVSVDETSGAVDIRIPPNPPRVHASSVRFVAQTSAKENAAVVSILSVKRFDARFEDDNSLLPRPLTAALMLAAGVASDQTGGSWDMTASKQSGYEGLFAYSMCKATADRSALRFAWPLPPSFSLPFYAAFSARWNAKVCDPNKVPQEPWTAKSEKIDEMARNFLFLVVYLWSESTTLQFEAKEKAPSWAILAALVAGLMDRGAAPWRNWAMKRAGLLAAPEYGLSPSAANSWLKALRDQVDEEGWASLSSSLQAERSARATAAGVDKPGGLLAQIDARFPDHHWAEMIEGRAVVAAQQEQVKSSSRQALAPENEMSPIHELKRSLSAIRVSLLMTDSTTERLATLQSDQIRALANTLNEFRELPDVQPQALTAVWKKAVELHQRPDLEELVDVQRSGASRGELVVQPLLSTYGKPAGSTAIRSLTTNSGMKVEALILQRPDFIWQGAVLPPALSGLYSFLWDVAIDRIQSESTVSVFPQWWPGVTIALPQAPGTHLQLWPSFQWPMVRQIEPVIEQWNVAAVNAVTRAQGSFGDQVRVDALAFWMIEISAQSRVVDGPSMRVVEPRLDVSSDERRRVVGQTLASFQGATNPTFVGALNAWTESVALLAAPEVGLSIDAAKSIIAGYPQRLDGRDFFKALRQQRLLDAGIDEKEVEKVLAAIDKDAAACAFG